MVTEENIGQLIRYWDNGARVGILVSIKKNNAIIQHSVLKEKQQIPLGECEPLQPEKEKEVDTIFSELFKAAQTVGTKRQSIEESDSEYLTALVRAITVLPSEEWQQIPAPAQIWWNEAVDNINGMRPIPPCPGFMGLEAIAQTKDATPKKGLTAKEVFTNRPSVGFPPANPTSQKKQKAPGIMDATRRTAMLHPDWSPRQVYEYLKLNGFPNAKLDTISIDCSIIKKTIQIARELGLWNDPKPEKVIEEEREEQRQEA